MKYLFLIEYIEVKDVKSCKDQEKLNQSKVFEKYSSASLRMRTTSFF